MTKPCQCCAGIELVTPMPAANRPGLDAITYRVGAYGTFLESMLARLSSAPPNDPSDPKALSPLTALRIRSLDDPSIALLDAWAVVADVLTFYQERIANEGYLRTAIERRSVQELARLLGYKPRPGVASSVYLAFTLQDGFDVDIASGTAAKTTPGPGELPQTFETSAAIYARSAWNELVPRRTRPQRITLQNANEIASLYMAGTSTRLKRNDRLLLVFGDDTGQQFIRRVQDVEEDHTNNRTKVTLQVEAFSAAQFSIETKKILEDQIRGCPDLANVASVQALQDSLAKSNPLSVLSAAVTAARLDLISQGSGAQGALKDLTAVHDIAAALSSSLSAFLAKPHTALGKNIGDQIALFTIQQDHAGVAAAALKKFSDLMDAGAGQAPNVAALIAADAALKNEAKPAPGFAALASSLTALEKPVAKPLATVQKAIQSAVDTLKPVLAAAVAIVSDPDKDLIQTLKAIQAAINKASGAGQQMVAIEEAVSSLDGRTAVDGGLLGNLKKINDTLASVTKPGANPVDPQLQKAASLVANSELLPDADQQQKLDTLRTAVRTLQSKLSGPLVDQQAALTSALSGLQSIPTFGFPLLKQRLQELTTALEAAPAGVVQQDLKTLLDAKPVPAVSDAKAKAHAAAVSGFVDDVESAGDFFTAVGNANAAAGQLKGEAASIQADLQSAQDEQGCFTAAASALQLEQVRFLSHFAKLFRDLAAAYRSTLPAAGGDQAAGTKVLGALDTVVAKAAVPEDFDAPLTKVIEQVDATGSALPGSQLQLRQWFSSLSRDLKSAQAAINANQSQPPQPPPQGKGAFLQLKEIAASLLQTPAAATPAPADLKTAFGAGSDAVARSLVVMKPGLGDQLLLGWGNIKVDLPVVEVYAFRVRSSLFGYNAPKLRRTVVTDIPSNGHGGQQFDVLEDGDPSPDENRHEVSLESGADQIVPASWVVVQAPASSPVFAKAADVSSAIGIARYGMTGKTTRISLGSPKDPAKGVDWFELRRLTFPAIRGTTVWAQAEPVALAELPLTDPVGPSTTPPVTGDSVELDGYFDGLEAGRFVAINGERTDVAGVIASELAQIAAVEQVLDPTLPGDTLHTQLQFTVALRHQYQRGSVKINANVAHATHGETQKEVLGSGNGSTPFPVFTLAKPPLTYLSQPTPSGAESTLQVRVNDILWHEAPNLAALRPNDREYVIDIADDGTTSVTFGDGIHGGRLPTGVENVRAVYRSGIGKGGNVVAKKIAMLPSPPLGVTSVSNPAPAAGGADAETRDQARRNAPAAVLSLDRLVSVRDYADYARTYAGIAKANASLDAGMVTVIIAGIDDIPIDPASDLFHNLLASIEQFGDPHQPVTLEVRKLSILVLQADLAIDPDYDFKVVSGQITAELLDRFGFERQELGEAVILSQVISVIQSVSGVLYVDVEYFDAIPEIDSGDPDPQKITDFVAKLGKPKQGIAIAPDEIAYFSPDLPETIVLKHIAPKGIA